jgi:hypothetical protein
MATQIIKITTENISSQYVPQGFPNGSYYLFLNSEDEYGINWLGSGNGGDFEYAVDLGYPTKSDVHILVGNNTAFWGELSGSYITGTIVFYNLVSGGTGMVTVSFYPPKVINPTPTDGKLNVNINLNNITWGLPE